MFWTISQIVWAHWEQTVCRPISMLWALGYLVNLQRKNYAILTHSHTHKPGKKKKKKERKRSDFTNSLIPRSLRRISYSLIVF